MNNKTLIEKIKKAAKADAQKRKDPRYKYAMAFLVKKGFLKANTDFTPYYRAKVNAKDLIWAGKNVEPRILEVLPAAALRLPRAVKITGITEDEMLLKKVIAELKENQADGHAFLKMPYAKIKVWLDLQLNDGRTKARSEKKLLKNFRLKPETIKMMEELRAEYHIESDTALIEFAIAKAARPN